jgi:hypothetical protein
MPAVAAVAPRTADVFRHFPVLPITIRCEQPCGQSAGPAARLRYRVPFCSPPAVEFRKYRSAGPSCRATYHPAM